MARVLIVGAGMAGLSAAIMLARDGHAVTVVERDPAAPPAPDRPDEAWRGWERRGVNQFVLPHFMQPQWWIQVCAELPEACAPLAAAGALRGNMVTMLPEGVRGPVRADDTRFDFVTARRPVLEAALSAAADSVGVEIRRGVAVTGLDTRPGAPVPHVTGVTTADGTLAADLVVDCTGRRSKVAEWLVAAGARPPVEERADSGYAYYGRHFRSGTGRQPAALSWLHQFYSSLSMLTLPADNGTWSVVIIVGSHDKPLRMLRDADRWSAAVALYPTVAHWTDAEPITGVDVIAGIEDRFRRLSVDGQPVATGVGVHQPVARARRDHRPPARPAAARRAAPRRGGRPRAARPPIRPGHRRGRRADVPRDPLVRRPPVGRVRRRHRRGAVPDRRRTLADGHG